MTRDPDDDKPSEDPEGVRREGDRKLDEDAAWRSIVENYGDPVLPLAEEDDPPPEPGEVAAEPPRFAVFERRWPDPLNSEADWEDEGHFIPPEPPPLPTLEPRRKLAWTGLFGSPVMMLAAVVFGWSYPQWFSFILVTGFLGGFGYLVATMPRTRGGDGPGDDGAVV
jgi:hypothetical protein